MVESWVLFDAVDGFDIGLQEEVAFSADSVDGVGIVDGEAFEEPVGFGDIVGFEVGDVFVFGGIYGAPVSWEAGVVDWVAEWLRSFHEFPFVVGE